MKTWVRWLQVLETMEKLLRLMRAVIGIALVLMACGAFRNRRFG